MAKPHGQPGQYETEEHKQARKSFLQSVREGYYQERDAQRLAAAADPHGIGITKGMFIGAVIGLGLILVIMLLMMGVL